MSNIEAVCIVSTCKDVFGRLPLPNACCRAVEAGVHYSAAPPSRSHHARARCVQIFSNMARNSNDDRAWLTGNGAILRLDGGLEPNHTLFVAALTKMKCPEPF